MIGRFRSIAAAGALLALCTPALDAQLRGPEVESVRFEGNESFPSDSLARAIATRETSCRSRWFIFPVPFCPLGFDFALSRSTLRQRDLPRDRARLILWYRQRGFPDVEVDSAEVEQSPTRARVTFSIEEGQAIVTDSLVFRGAEPFADTPLLEDLPLVEGARLSTIAMNAARDTLIRRLSNDGYAYAEVLLGVVRPAEDPYRAVVTFDVIPGPETRYGEITITGLESLSPGTVRRTVQLETGRPYRRSEVDDATGRLFGLDIVRNASVIPDTASIEQDPSIDVVVQVQEGDAFRVRAGGGWSQAECLSAEARWSSRNFFGGGRTLTVRGRVANILAGEFRDVLCTQSGQGEFGQLTGVGSVDFVQPWIFSTRNALSASLFVERQSLPDIFIRRAIGGQVGLSRTLSARTQLAGFYRPELSELDASDVLFCTGFLVCTPGDIDELEEANRLAPVGLSFTRDRSDDLLNPRRGYRLLLDVEHAAGWTFSDFRYDRVVVEASRYAALGRVVFATRVRGGWVGSGGFEGLVDAGPTTSFDIVHPQKRFYTGGANSVRGFAQSRLGPRVLFAEPANLLESTGNGGGNCTPQSLEQQTCAADPGADYVAQPTGGTRLLEANAELRFSMGFVEGVVFTDVGQAWGPTQSILLEDLEFTPGVGVRFASPVGPIRVDLAYRFRGGENLQVVSERIRPLMAGDDPGSRLLVGNQFIDWVSTGDLVLLDPLVLFGRNDRGIQLHVSIGQAF